MIVYSSNKGANKQSGVLAILLGLAVIGFVSYKTVMSSSSHSRQLMTAADEKLGSQQAVNNNPDSAEPVKSDTDQAAALNNSVSKVISAYPDIDIGITYSNLTTGYQLILGDSEPFVGASVTKLITAADFLNQVEKDKYKLSQTLGSGTAEYQLNQMINQSNNDSWYEFIELLSYQQIESYGQSIGLKSFKFTGDNLITASDQALFLQKLYSGELLNTAHTSLILSYMHDTNEDSLIPTALPATATFYHKYGEVIDDYDKHAGYYLHDSAIVEVGSQHFILAIFTKSSSSTNRNLQVTAIHDLVTVIVGSLPK